jgi:hypothetical protein
MNALQGMVAAVALVLPASTLARGPDVDGIEHWSMPGFELYAPDRSQAQTVASQIKPIERALSTLFGKDFQPTGLPLRIYVAPQAVWHRYLRPSRSIVAEFIPARFANYILMDSYHDTLQVRGAVNHEYAHYFLRSQSGGEIPLWFDEGVAEIARSIDFWSKSVRVGLPRGRGSGWLSMDRLLRAEKTSEEYLSSSTTGAFHFQSWAFVHRAWFHDPAFGDQMRAYLRAVNLGMPIDEAVQASFGMSTAELERVIAGHAKRRTFGIAKLPFDPPAQVKLDAGRRMGEIEALELLGQIMFDTGLNPSRLGEVIAAAKAIAPDKTPVLIMELRLAAREGDVDGIKKAWSSVEGKIADPVIARAAGLALFERIRPQLMGESPASDEAGALATPPLELLLHSERVLPVDAEAAWALGLLSALMGRETEFASQRLAAAASAVPRNGDLAMARAVVYESRGQVAEFQQQLVETVKYSRTARQIIWARSRLGEIAGGARKSP